MAAVILKSDNDNIKDSEDSWLYGPATSKPEENINDKIDNPEIVQNGENKITDDDIGGDVRGEPTTPVEAAATEADGNEVDSEEDDIQVTIGDIKPAAYEKFKNTYPQRPAGSTAVATAKPPPKGVVDMDAVGSINGVPVYEYDIDSLKIEDKPWRKPGADITDYFNYGFNEDTWTKYCERQRRLRMDNNTNKHSNNVIYAPIQTIEHTGAQAIPKIESGGGQPRQIGMIPIRSSVIDVIGGHNSTTRRHDATTSLNQEFHQITSVSNVIPISMSMPPPMMNVHMPDFARPPPGTQMQSRAMPTAMPHAPPGMMPQIIVGPPPGYPGAPIPHGGYYRQNIITAPLQIQHDKRLITAYPGDRPPYRFDASFPPPFQPPHAAPPGTFIHRVETFSGERQTSLEGAPAWPLKSDDDISSSGDETNRLRENEQNENRDHRYEHAPPLERQRPRIHHDLFRSRADERSRERSHERREHSENHSRSRDRNRGRDYERRHHRERDDRRHHSSKRRSSRDSRDGKSRSKHKKSSRNQISESETSDSDK